MTDEIAFKAVDYLVASSSENETLAIVFFGGEPMINEPLIWKTVDYSKRIYPNRNFTYSITTNGTLLNDTLIIDFIRTPPTFIRTCADECGNPIP